MKTTRLLAILLISALSFTACQEDDHNHDDHDHEHEHQEEINNLRYRLTNAEDTTDVVIFTFTDQDGEGGADGTSESSGTLTANATYTGELELLHEDDDEMEDIGAEIAEEDAEDHEIFYTTKVAGLNFEVVDVDKNNDALGFKTNVSTGDAGIGILTISVIHEGKKPNNGTIEDALSAEGTTDIEVSFNVTVE